MPHAIIHVVHVYTMYMGSESCCIRDALPLHCIVNVWALPSELPQWLSGRALCLYTSTLSIVYRAQCIRESVDSLCMDETDAPMA